MSDNEDARRFLASLQVGDVRSGTVTSPAGRRQWAVTLDDFPTRPLGLVGPLEQSWSSSPKVAIGDRVTVGVVAVDLDREKARLSLAPAADPELWAFLSRCRLGEVLSGVVAAIERFGVFVALDDGPSHPVFPGVGFVTIPELSWGHLDSAGDVVQVGQRIACEFLHFDTYNGEARLSLRALRPDPFQAFAGTAAVGQTLRGPVTKQLPFGVFVRVADGVEGLVHNRDLASDEILPVGAEITVMVTEIDRKRRRLALSQRSARPDSATS